MAPHCPQHQAQIPQPSILAFRDFPVLDFQPHPPLAAFNTRRPQTHPSEPPAHAATCIHTLLLLPGKILLVLLSQRQLPSLLENTVLYCDRWLGKFHCRENETGRENEAKTKTIKEEIALSHP